MNKHAQAVKAALVGSDTGMDHFRQLLRDIPGDFSLLIEALSPNSVLDEDKIKTFKDITIDFNNLDLSRHLAQYIYTIIEKRCNRLEGKHYTRDEGEALLTLYLIHRLREGFNKGCIKAGLDPENIEAYLEEVI